MSTNKLTDGGEAPVELVDGQTLRIGSHRRQYQLSIEGAVVDLRMNMPCKDSRQ
jgi:hypothetical protein